VFCCEGGIFLICEECKERPATLHFTKVMNGDKTEAYLCEQCAKGNGETLFKESSTDMSLHNWLATLLHTDYPFVHQKTDASLQPHLLRCETCKLTYQHFTESGRFGCANCYEVFQNQLPSFLTRLHGGHMTHIGKVPRKLKQSISTEKEILHLKECLQQQIHKEEFEEAAKTRDHIRYLEQQLATQRRGNE
jgi:protein arginine kinase activator